MSVEKVVHSQRLNFETNRTKDISYRKNMLEQLLSNIEEKEDAICNALEKDLMKCHEESYIFEVAQVENEIKNCIKNIRKWAKPEKRKTPPELFFSKSYVFKEPFGVVLILSPWNYPFSLSLQPLVSAIAAGNCVILKMSRKSPNTAQIVDAIINETFPSNYVKVLNPETDYSEIMSASYDFIFFTGSQRVGRMIMRQAGENLTPVVLELGGKSPCIIDKDADLLKAAKKIAWGKIVNAGQTCVAPDYCLIPAEMHDEFIELLKEQFDKMMPNPLENDQYGKIVNLHHYMRLRTAIANNHNAIGGASDSHTNKIAPAIFPNCSFEDDIMKNEIFGPILAVIPYDSIEEAIIHIKKMDRPLATYVFSRNPDFQEKIVNEISFGNGCINDVLIQAANKNLPFGGVGNSGMGKYHGKDGFDTFSNAKAVMKNNWSTNLQHPPYTEKKMKWIFYFLR